MRAKELVILCKIWSVADWFRTIKNILWDPWVNVCEDFVHNDICMCHFLKSTLGF